MSDALTTATITENGASVFAVAINVSGHQLSGDEPIASGGGDTGPAPYDLLTAALGECTAMTVRWYAKQKNWPLEKVEVVIAYRKEALTEGARPSDIFEKSITLYGKDLSNEQRQKLIDVAAKCPVQRTLEGAPVIRTLTAPAE
jgi:putative redox protein